MKEGIIISEEHGVNPSINVCLLCEKELSIILFGKLKDDKKAPMKCCVGEICEDCRNKLLSDKKIVIVDDIGRYIIIKEELLTPKGLEIAKKSRIIYVSEELFNELTK